MTTLHLNREASVPANNKGGRVNMKDFPTHRPAMAHLHGNLLVVQGTLLPRDMARHQGRCSEVQETLRGNLFVIYNLFDKEAVGCVFATIWDLIKK